MPYYEGGEDKNWYQDSKRLAAMGEEPRHLSRRELIPWDVKPEHGDSRFRLMFQAEARRRAGTTLSRTDSKYVALLDNLLIGRGTPLVVGYHQDVGFFLTDRLESDQDIIRVTEVSPDNVSAV